MALDHKIRIIGGFLKGRKLDVLDVDGLRPTTDRTRETLFNWLGESVVGASVLDLFAGSGALGIESYSRGAKEVHLVEKDAANAASLQAMINTLPASPLLTPKAPHAPVTVHHADALNYVQSLPQGLGEKGQGFDVIFLDPPFQSQLLEKAVQLIIERGLLNEEGLVYVEMDKSHKKLLFGLEMIRDTTIGMSHIGLYHKSFFF